SGQDGGTEVAAFERNLLRVEAELSFLLVRTVAAVTMFGEQGLNLFYKIHRVLGGGGQRGGQRFGGFAGVSGTSGSAPNDNQGPCVNSNPRPDGAKRPEVHHETHIPGKQGPQAAAEGKLRRNPKRPAAHRFQ